MSVFYSLFLFAKSARYIKSHLFRKKIQRLISKLPYKPNTLPWLINLIACDPLQLRKLSLPPTILLLLILLSSDLYNLEKWKQLHNTMEVHIQMQDSFRGALVKLIICIIMLIFLFILSKLLIKKNLSANSILIFLPLILSLLVSIFIIKRLHQQTVKQISTLHCILYLFHPRLEYIAPTLFFSQMSDYYRIKQYIAMGLDQSIILKKFTGITIDIPVDCYREFTSAIEGQTTLQLLSYQDKLNNYIQIFLQLFIVLIVATALLMTFNGTRELMHSGISKELYHLDANNLPMMLY